MFSFKKICNSDTVTIIFLSVVFSSEWKCENKQEYPSDPLCKISALQTKVELAGNLSDKQNLAENLADRELASWENVFLVYK